jgi:hypothetical protein
MKNDATQAGSMNEAIPAPKIGEQSENKMSIATEYAESSAKTPQPRGAFGVRQIDPFRKEEPPPVDTRPNVFQELLDRPTSGSHIHKLLVKVVFDLLCGGTVINSFPFVPRKSPVFIPAFSGKSVDIVQFRH